MTGSVPRVSCFLLVDERGWVLLQERDDDAPTHANQWCTPGGQVEAGETFEDAVYREAWEETGVVFRDGDLEPWLTELHDCPYCGPIDHAFYFADVDLVDADIRCTEGRQLVFCDPALIPDLALTPSSRYFLSRFWTFLEDR
ncbi:NUDIX domain-containing protein [Nocardioides sp. Bht2]|uniref:NUDIX domain-containing protein n=1 Tax=Nocardioides sp. Bht2 TaxID=3392297 RepID=UPI0039B4BA93